MRYESPGAVIDVQAPWATSGLVGTLAVRLVKVTTGGADTTVTARHTTLIVENPAGSKQYEATLTLPSTAGDYAPVWDDGTTFWRGPAIRVTHDVPAAVGGTGNPYFTPAEFRARYTGNADATALTDDAINAARAIAEDIIERACHVAFVVREKTLTVTGDWSSGLKLPLYRLRTVESVDIDGDAQDVSDYRVGSGSIYRSAAWPRSVGNVVVTVTHGLDAPPAHLKDAAMTLTYHRAVKGPIDDRAVSVSAGEVGGVINLLTPGVGSAITGIPDVDAAIIANRLPAPGSVSSVLVADTANTYPDLSDNFAIG